MLVVLEGLDGAGKSTQVRRFREYIAQTSGEPEYIHFPRMDTGVHGKLIARFLKGDFGKVDQVHPQLVALLYAEDRRNALPEIRSALDAGRTVLLDRYVCSNIAYQCAKTHDKAEADTLRQWILDTEYGDFGLPKPDLTIFLDVPMSFVEHNLSSQRQGRDRDYLQGGRDIHEEDLGLQARVRDMYLNQAGLDPNFVVVDCSDGCGGIAPADVIFQKIKDVYENR